MDCPQCKAQIPDDAVFCQACGARVAAPEEGAETTQSPQGVMGPQGPSAGAERRAGYCDVCGQELGVEEKLRSLTVHERCRSLVRETPAQAMAQLPSQEQPTEAVLQDETPVVAQAVEPPAPAQPARRPLAADEMYCSSCGNVMKKEAVMCVSCGVPSRRAQVTAYAGGLAGRGEGKNKVLSILLAIFFGNWTWLYTYREDGTKFWVTLAVLVVGFILAIATLGIGFFLYIPASLAIWIWAIADTVSRSDAWYLNY